MRGADGSAMGTHEVDSVPHKIIALKEGARGTQREVPLYCVRWKNYDPVRDVTYEPRRLLDAETIRQDVLPMEAQAARDGELELRQVGVRAQMRIERSLRYALKKRFGQSARDPRTHSLARVEPLTAKRIFAARLDDLARHKRSGPPSSRTWRFFTTTDLFWKVFPHRALRRLTHDESPGGRTRRLVLAATGVVRASGERVVILCWSRSEGKVEVHDKLKNEVVPMSVDDLDMKPATLRLTTGSLERANVVIHGITVSFTMKEWGVVKDKLPLY